MATGDVIGYAKIIDGGRAKPPDISAELEELYPEHAEIERLRAENARLRAACQQADRALQRMVALPLSEEDFDLVCEAGLALREALEDSDG